MKSSFHLILKCWFLRNEKYDFHISPFAWSLRRLCAVCMCVAVRCEFNQNHRPSRKQVKYEYVDNINHSLNTKIHQANEEEKQVFRRKFHFRTFSFPLCCTSYCYSYWGHRHCMQHVHSPHIVCWENEIKNFVMSKGAQAKENWWRRKTTSQPMTLLRLDIANCVLSFDVSHCDFRDYLLTVWLQASKTCAKYTAEEKTNDAWTESWHIDQSQNVFSSFAMEWAHERLRHLTIY